MAEEKKDAGQKGKKGLGPEKIGADEDVGGGVFRSLSTLTSMGITLVASTFIGLIIGIYLDGYFSTHPWLTLIFLLLGIVAGFKNIYSLIKRYGVWH
ncbi:MAG: AtpZ/AtpI family protein [Deltaproteobacteria bacterium]|nr:AtpZ/AtpI family protein [Deltaproteobacteria bacterium]